MIKFLLTNPLFKNQIKHVEYIPKKEAIYKEPKVEISKQLIEALNALGINNFYLHQAQAIEKIKEGKNVLLVTPAASGKTLSYNVPVIEEIIVDKNITAFYLFPTKALAQDQLKTLTQLIEKLDIDNVAVTYDGDTPSHIRAYIKEYPPNIIITNPDMVNLAFLPYHSSWANFLKRLKFIVVDEVHTYRGVFGSHFAHIIRRLRRICNYYGSEPQFIVCSATISEPEEFIEQLFGLKFEIIKDNGAPQSGKYFIMWEPLSSPYTEATYIVKEFVDNNLKTICFTKSRKITELIHRWCIEENEYKNKIYAYRAGYLPAERREIEKKMFNDEIEAIISTSALELGMDIGSLDTSILVGYPGSIMSVWQRSGRCGRRGKDAIIVMIALDDALDKYFINNPDKFFSMGYEKAIIDTNNEIIFGKHLLAAAAELPIDRFRDYPIFGDSLEDELIKLKKEGKLFEGADERFYCRLKNPQREINIRSIGEEYQIIDIEKNTKIATTEYPRVLKDCHQGAIYLHAGSEYLVLELNFNNRCVYVKEVQVDYFTQPKSTENVEIEEVYDEKKIGNIKVYLGKIEVTEEVYGYIKKNISTQEKITEYMLDLPPYVYSTTAIWIELPVSLIKKLIDKDYDIEGALHATEHALIAMFPFFALCDRFDLGGVSYSQYPSTGVATIFVHDAYPGGVGLAKRAYEIINELISATYKLIRECKCFSGCPACIQSPKCGNNNEPLHKKGAIVILEELIKQKEKPKEVRVKAEVKKKVERKESIIFLDTETKELAEDVGGWEYKDKMGIAVAVIYDTADDKFYYYLEYDLDKLLAKLKQATLVVGFNIKNFDYKVLQPYFKNFQLNNLPTFDLLEQIEKQLGYRVSLNHLARVTLSIKKIANGTQAVSWYKEGKLSELIEYCKHDVFITKELYEFAKKYGYLLIEENFMIKKVNIVL